jgi:hypothetical protein
MIKEMFNRIELKYLIPFADFQAIAAIIESRMAFDRFGDRFGRYKITSLYFDSPEHHIYFETVNRLPIRQKLRMRLYERPADSVRGAEPQTALSGGPFLRPVFFELKQKYNNRINKRRTVMELQDASRFVQAQEAAAMDYASSNPQVLREIASYRSRNELMPRVIVEYERQAFEGVEDEDLRVTFDYRLACRHDDLRLDGRAAAVPFVDPNLVILEVKVRQSVPFWLARVLSDYRCEMRGVSKYCSSVDTVCPISDTVSERRRLFHNPRIGGLSDGAAIGTI